MNECTFIGNLGADVEVKSFQNGGRIANLRIAVSERWKDRATGEAREHTEWIPIVIQSEGLVGVAEKYLRKGSKILIRGKWKTRKWQDRDGNDRYSTEVVVAGMGGTLTMLDSASGGGERSSTRHRNQDGVGSDGGWGQDPDLDDDLPF